MLYIKLVTWVGAILSGLMLLKVIPMDDVAFWSLLALTITGQMIEEAVKEIKKK